MAWDTNENHVIGTLVWVWNGLAWDKLPTQTLGGGGLTVDRYDTASNLPAADFFSFVHD